MFLLVNIYIMFISQPLYALLFVGMGWKGASLQPISLVSREIWSSFPTKYVIPATALYSASHTSKIQATLEGDLKRIEISSENVTNVPVLPVAGFVCLFLLTLMRQKKISFPELTLCADAYSVSVPP